MNPPIRRTATTFGSPTTRVRQAIEKALANELQIDASHDATRALLAAGLNDRVARFGRELDRFYDDMAGAVCAQAKPLISELASIHEAADRHERERLDRAPRISGLVRGPVPS